jgi:hypothetical protein
VAEADAGSDAEDADADAAGTSGFVHVVCCVAALKK